MESNLLEIVIIIDKCNHTEENLINENSMKRILIRMILLKIQALVKSFHRGKLCKFVQVNVLAASCCLDVFALWQPSNVWKKTARRTRR